VKIWVYISFFVTDVVYFNYYLACNFFYINLFIRLLIKQKGFLVHLFVLFICSCCSVYLIMFGVSACFGLLSK